MLRTVIDRLPELTCPP